MIKCEPGSVHVVLIFVLKGQSTFPSRKQHVRFCVVFTTFEGVQKIPLRRPAVCRTSCHHRRTCTPEWHRVQFPDGFHLSPWRKEGRPTTVQVADDIRSAMDEAWQRLPQTTVNGLMDRPPDQKEACIAA
ncbi:hypothetical protein TNCV_2537611 [Trichonephila clavipes]|nr:hypothetical protein TNCV_2537611 [Trichonephila clavipes]